MKRLLVGVVLLAMVAACGGGGGVATPTSPTGSVPTPPVATPVTATRWQGTIVAIRRTLAGPLDTTQTFEGAVTFERGDISGYEPPDLVAPLVPGNAVTYVLKPGLLQLTHVGSIAPCSYGGSTWDVLMKSTDGYLIVNPNGSFDGRITLPDTTFPVTVTCPTGSARGETSVQMDLTVRGSSAGTRISGTMTPRTVANSMFSGSWTLEGR